MTATILNDHAGSKAPYRRDDYIFPRVRSGDAPVKSVGVKAVRIIAPICNAILRFVDVRV